MSIYSKEVSNTVSQGESGVYGFNTILMRAKDGAVDLSEYETMITSLVVSGELDVNTPKEFPIVYHFIYDNIKQVTYSSDPDPYTHPITIRVDLLNEQLNTYFSGTNISFALAPNDPEDTALDIAGLNLIDGSGENISQYRDGVENSDTDGTYVHTYSRDLVVSQPTTISDFDVSAQSQGVLLSYLYEQYQWDPTRYINVFLVNRILNNSNECSSTLTPVAGTTPSQLIDGANPHIDYITDNLGLFNVAIDISSLCTPRWDPKEDDEGHYFFRYKRGEVSEKSFQNSSAYLGTGGRYYGGRPNDWSMLHAAKSQGSVLAKAMGYMFGLSPITVGERGAPDGCPDENSACVWSGWQDSDICGDCMSDTYKDSARAILTFAMGGSSAFYNAYNCTEESPADVWGNIMSTAHKRLSTYFSDTTKTYSIGLSLEELRNRGFSSQQKDRMHANIALLYQDTETLITSVGILKTILQNNSEAPPENSYWDPTLEVWVTIPTECEGGRSHSAEGSLRLATKQITADYSRATRFQKLKLKIKSITI